MKILTQLCCILGAMSFLTATSHAQQATHVAIYASYDTGEIGTGLGNSKRAALSGAKKSCKTVNGKPCKYYYWTKATSNMAVVRCNFDMSSRAEGIFSVKGGHDENSLAAATQKAFAAAAKQVKGTGFKATKDNCQILVTYSAGAFSK